jgi:hypothetical protein
MAAYFGVDQYAPADESLLPDQGDDINQFNSPDDFPDTGEGTPSTDQNDNPLDPGLDQ